MVFIQDFYNFFLTSLPIIIDNMMSFFNMKLIDVITVVLAPFPLSNAFINAINSLLNTLVETNYLDIALWKFLLYNFGIILTLSIIAKFWDALPFV